VWSVILDGSDDCTENTFIFYLGAGIAKVLYNKETEELLGVHIIGLHAADLIQECANAMAAGSTVRELSYMVSDCRYTLRTLDQNRKGCAVPLLLKLIALNLMYVQVHTHPTLCEVLDEAFKAAVGRAAH